MMEILKHWSIVVFLLSTGEGQDWTLGVPNKDMSAVACVQPEYARTRGQNKREK